MDNYRKECFGLPYGNLIFAIVAGIFLILIGLSSIIGIDIWNYIWPIMAIIIGLVIILAAIYGYSRS